MPRPSRAPTPEQRTKYLELLAEGKMHVEAARAVGSTGSRFRSLRGRDEEFNAKAEAVEHERDDGYRESLRSRIRTRALSVEADADRIAVTEARVHLPEYAVLNQRRVEMTGAGGGPLEVSHADAIDREIGKLLGEMAARGEATPTDPAPAS